MLCIQTTSLRFVNQLVVLTSHTFSRSRQLNNVKQISSHFFLLFFFFGSSFISAITSLYCYAHVDAKKASRISDCQTQSPTIAGYRYDTYIFFCMCKAEARFGCCCFRKSPSSSLCCGVGYKLSGKKKVCRSSCFP